MKWLTPDERGSCLRWNELDEDRFLSLASSNVQLDLLALNTFSNRGVRRLQSVSQPPSVPLCRGTEGFRPVADGWVRPAVSNRALLLSSPWGLDKEFGSK